MRLVIENVSARYVGQDGVLAPLALGEPGFLGDIDKPVACFPWIPAFEVVDLVKEPVWFAFNCPTRIYVDGPVDHVTFGANFRTLESDDEGVVFGRLCISGHMEAQPQL